jgi:iron complex outermembrane recepter protein
MVGSILLAAGFALAGKATAQESTTSPPTITLPEVTVRDTRESGYVPKDAATGTKTDTPLLETPQSLSVITREQMETQGVNSLAEALRYTPGVTGELFGLDTRGYGIMFRGFNDDSDTTFYRDGLQLRGSAFATFLPLDPYGAERFEVLRGPTSVLYGQNGPGGLINYVTKRPTGERWREFEIGGGSHSRYEGKFDFSGPIDKEGKFLYRLTGLGRDGGTQVDFVDLGRIYIAPALTWRPSNNTTLTLLGNYQHDDTGWGIQFYPAAGTVRRNANGRVPPRRFTGEPDFDVYRLNQYAIGYLLDHRLGDTWTVKQSARYARLDNRQKGVFGNGLDPLDPSQRTLLRYGDTGKTTLHGFTIDNQAQARFATGPLAHTLLFGVDHQRYRFSDLGTAYSVDALDLYAPVYGAPVIRDANYQDTDARQYQVGLYLQNQIKVYEKLILLLGGRYDWAKSTTKDSVIPSITKQKDGEFTGRAGMVYVFDIGLAPYFSYSESFLPTLGSNAGGKPFVPETGRQYEVGIKYQPSGWKSFITLAAFDLRRQNVLTPDPNNPVLNQVQTGEVRSRGIELEGVMKLSAQLNIIAAYTFLDTEVTKSTVEGEEGKRPVAAPQHMATLWSDYEIQDGALRGLTFGAGVRYMGSSYGDNLNTLKVPDYALVDATLRYDLSGLSGVLGLESGTLKGWSVSTNIKNLFDKDHIASCFSDASCFYGPSRSIVGSLRYRW